MTNTSQSQAVWDKSLAMSGLTFEAAIERIAGAWAVQEAAWSGLDSATDGGWRAAVRRWVLAVDEVRGEVSSVRRAASAVAQRLAELTEDPMVSVEQLQHVPDEWRTAVGGLAWEVRGRSAAGYLCGPLSTIEQELLTRERQMQRVAQMTPAVTP